MQSLTDERIELWSSRVNELGTSPSETVCEMLFIAKAAKCDAMPRSFCRSERAKAADGEMRETLEPFAYSIDYGLSTEGARLEAGVESELARARE